MSMLKTKNVAYVNLRPTKSENDAHMRHPTILNNDIYSTKLAATVAIVGVDGPAASRAKVWLSPSEPEGPST
jgi:mRNA-degrading endonuclease toxin of MazEF toxin-antitoxin module